MADKYEYQPLNPLHPDAFRYLNLYPGTGDDPIECDLYTARLSETAEAPSPGHKSYKAISYVWGSPGRVVPITCQGKTLHITANLKDTLCRIRLPHRHCYLWADSICINQGDPDEKGHQVGLMGDIYSRATEVIIDLGPAATEEAASATALFRDISGTLSPTNLRKSLAWLQRGPSRTSLEALFTLPWFQRGWVVQEAARARRATVLWGTAACDWDALMWAHQRAFESKSDGALHKVQALVRLHASLWRLRQFAADAWDGPGFLEILSLARHLRITDERDRVFAFLNVTSHLPGAPKPPVVLPNYHVRFQDVYAALARDEIRTSRHAGILRWVQHDDNSLGCQMPSWVPRWDIHLFSDVALHTGHIHEYGQPAGCPTPPTIIEGSLELRALVVGTVGSASDVIRESAIPEDILKVRQEVHAYRIPGSCPRPSGTRSGAFLQALSLSMVVDPPLSKGRFDYLMQLDDTLTMCSAGGPAPTRQQAEADEDAEAAPARQAYKWETSADELRFHRELIRRAANRKFVVTDNGCYGTVPPLTQSGDVCAILLGAGVPFVLRKTDVAGRYKIIGEAFMVSEDVGPIAANSLGDWPSRMGLEEKTITIV